MNDRALIIFADVDTFGGGERVVYNVRAFN